jgi:hypothetical protein
MNPNLQNGNRKSPGVTINAGQPLGVLTRYRVQLIRPGFAPLELSHSCLSKSLVTTWALDQAQSRGFSADWMCGAGVDRATARKRKVRVLERQPGAGRPAKPAGEKFVPIPADVHPKVLESIKVAAFASGRSIGEEITSRFP